MILKNKIRCNKCKDEIESTYRWDFKWCKCGAVAVDGGKDYLKRCGDIDKETSEMNYTDLSEMAPDPEATPPTSLTPRQKRRKSPPSKRPK